MQVVIQVILNVPEGSGLERTGHEYEQLIDEQLEEMINTGNLPGVSHVTTTFEDIV